MVPELKFKKILQVSEKQLGQNLHSIEKNYAVQKVQLDQSIKLVKKQLEILNFSSRLSARNREVPGFNNFDFSIVSRTYSPSSFFFFFHDTHVVPLNNE
jgi:hypothetical protein